MFLEQSDSQHEKKTTMQRRLLIKFANIFIFHHSEQCAIFKKNVAAKFINMNLPQCTFQSRVGPIDY